MSLGSPAIPRDIDAKMIDRSGAIQSSSGALAFNKPALLFPWRT
jgi:hypothetical protein